jgi:hypothetical protein
MAACAPRRRPVAEEDALRTGVEALAPHLDWAPPTMQARNVRRVGAPMARIRAFYDAIAPHMEGVLERFGALPADHPVREAERRLFHLGQAFRGWRWRSSASASPTCRTVSSARAGSA